MIDVKAALANFPYAEFIAKSLDEKDGKIDGRINASIWNEFVSDKGGKTIQNSITIENAIKSIKTYLNRITKSTGEDSNHIASQWLWFKQAVKDYEPQEQGSVKDESTENVANEQEVNKANEAFDKACKYVHEKYNKGGISRTDYGIYADIDHDGNYDIGFDKEGNVIFDLYDSPNPPSAKKTVWYNPLTWF